MINNLELNARPHIMSDIRAWFQRLTVGRTLLQFIYQPHKNELRIHDTALRMRNQQRFNK